MDSERGEGRGVQDRGRVDSERDEEQQKKKKLKSLCKFCRNHKMTIKFYPFHSLVCKENIRKINFNLYYSTLYISDQSLGFRIKLFYKDQFVINSEKSYSSLLIRDQLIQLGSILSILDQFL